MKLLASQTYDDDRFLVQSLEGDLTRWLREEGKPTQGVEVLAAVPLLSAGEPPEYGVVLYRDADGEVRVWTAWQYEDPWTAEYALDVLEHRAAGYERQARQSREFVALAKTHLLDPSKSRTDTEKVDLLLRTFRARHRSFRDRITLTDIANALGRDDAEKAALAEAFRGVDMDGNVYLQCAEIWLAHRASRGDAAAALDILDRAPDVPPEPDDEPPEERPRVSRTPGLMGGVPCVDGTRVTVATVLAEVFAGTFDEEIHRRYPTLPEGSVDACMRWAVEALRDELRTRQSLALLNSAADASPVTTLAEELQDMEPATKAVKETRAEFRKRSLRDDE